MTVRHSVIMFNSVSEMNESETEGVSLSEGKATERVPAQIFKE